MPRLFSPFNQHWIRELFDEKNQLLVMSVQRVSHERLTEQGSLDRLVAEVIKPLIIEPLRFDRDNLQNQIDRTNKGKGMFDRDITIPIIKYQLPFTGDQRLLDYHLNPPQNYLHEVYLEGRAKVLCFDVVWDNRMSEEQVRLEANEFIQQLCASAEVLAVYIEEENKRLPEQARHLFSERRKKLDEDNDLLSRLR